MPINNINIIEITDLASPDLLPYTMREVDLLRYYEPKEGLSLQKVPRSYTAP